MEIEEIRRNENIELAKHIKSIYDVIEKNVLVAMLNHAWVVFLVPVK